jgi:hypothetical protein
VPCCAQTTLAAAIAQRDVALLTPAIAKGDSLATLRYPVCFRIPHMDWAVAVVEELRKEDALVTRMRKLSSEEPVAVEDAIRATLAAADELEMGEPSRRSVVHGIARSETCESVTRGVAAYSDLRKLFLSVPRRKDCYQALQEANTQFDDAKARLSLEVRLSSLLVD